MRLLAGLIGLFVIVVGVVGVVAPAALLSAADYATTPIGLYVAAAFRIGIGIVLILVAPITRAPKLLRVFGVLAIAAGVITALVGVDSARAMVALATAQGTTLIRLGALLAVVFGGFVVFAVSARRAG